MRRIGTTLCSATLAGMVMLLGLTAIGANKQDVWRHDFTDAAREAKQTARPLLIHFHATWCGPCRQMEKDVLHHAEVRELLGRHFVAVLVDSDQHPELIGQFGIKGLPTDVVIAPAGTVLMVKEGGRDRRTYLTQLRQVLGRVPSQPESTAADSIAQTQHAVERVNSQPSEPKPDAVASQDSLQDARFVEKLNPGTPRIGETLPEETPARDEHPAAEAKLLVGLDRYSPVSLAKHRQWRKGKTEFALVYQGVVYLLCDDAEYRDFQSDPARYAPRLLGCDPVILWNSDRAIPGSTQFGAYFDGELFLFATPENRDRFKSSPTVFARPQHVLKVDQIDGPRWR